MVMKMICEKSKDGTCNEGDAICWHSGVHTATESCVNPECEYNLGVKCVPATPEPEECNHKRTRYLDERTMRYVCAGCHRLLESYFPKKETPMKYKQLKPISLEKLWDAQPDKTCVDFLKEWAVFMNMCAIDSFGTIPWGYDWTPTSTNGDPLIARFFEGRGKFEGRTQAMLDYAERHGFIAKEFEPFEIALPVNFGERFMKSTQWPLRIDRHSVWGEAICDQLKAHGIKV